MTTADYSSKNRNKLTPSPILTRHIQAVFSVSSVYLWLVKSALNIYITLTTLSIDAALLTALIAESRGSKPLGLGLLQQVA